MDDYAGRVLAGRYRLPLPASDEEELVETRALDTASGQEVLVRQVPLPEVVDAELIEDSVGPAAAGRADDGVDAVVQRALDAARAAAAIPDHPRLDQVFDVFAEDGSLWVVSELVPARPLAALLRERPLSPYRGAEVAADILTALRALHAHGWAHRNITPRTVLVCEDGRIVLTGLASGAAEEALCGFDPLPPPPGWGEAPRPTGSPGPPPEAGYPGSAGGGNSARRRRGGGRALAQGGRLPRLPDPVPVPGSGFLPARPEIAASREGAGSAHDGGGNARPQDDYVVPPGGLGTGAAARGGPGGGVPPQRGAAPPGRRSGWPESAMGGEARSHGGVAAHGHADEGYGPGRAGSVAAAMQRARARAQEAARVVAGPEYADQIGADRGAGVGDGGDYGRSGGHEAGDRHSEGAPGPGEATYGGSLPGARPDASIAVPLPGGALGSSGLTKGSPDAAGQPAAPQPDAYADFEDDAPHAYRGPTTRLAAERARHARMTMVGAVTERWAPEQAGTVHEHWQLAPPVGPAADLWALGALLFRAVQGHSAYPEENVGELVQMVCSEPPAVAEECGALRPVVESLLRQDPTERPDFEELRGWLRSLIRTAPEPEIGSRTVTVPTVGPGRRPGAALGAGRSDPRRLPVLRRRGELVRRRRSEAPVPLHGKHRRGGGEREKKKRGRGPRSLGRTLIALVFLAMAAVIAYAVAFMPKAGENGSAGEQRRGAIGGARESASAAEPPAAAPGEGEDEGKKDDDGGKSAQQSPTGPDPADLPKGFELRKDRAGFELAVDKDWRRLGENDRGQVRYVGGDYELVVVPGRDTVAKYGKDPMAYQQDREPELAAYRDSSDWSTASGLRRIDVGERASAVGEFTWKDSSGRAVYARNAAMILDGRYHVVQVLGPESERKEISVLFEQATNTYRKIG
ncbi:serine/threonine protein kinase [Streptomyces sp. A7024]|uniref:Serine/threonine protein kinase n=1 Tax=Streptomyces coryli TaxID=1128680 RepID=A0A6G4U7E4_9ACTN|nr:serine/threonine protein kinase [Streptomyces coryli]